MLREKINHLLAGIFAGSFVGVILLVIALENDQISTTGSLLSQLDLRKVSVRSYSIDDIQVLPIDKIECDISDAITKGKKLLEPYQPKIVGVPISYLELRAGKITTFSDPEKEIGLAILSLDTCTVSVISIIKRGNELIAPDGYSIKAVRRINGIQWNNWATEYEIKKPEKMTVIAVAYPLIEDGKLSEIIYYVPYSRALHIPSIASEGRVFLKKLSQDSYVDLIRTKILSKQFEIAPSFFERLALIEHIDMTEFLIDPVWASDRMAIVLALNKLQTSSHTCSHAGACGLMQFTEGTYYLMSRAYPGANLNSKFSDGAKDVKNAMRAAIVLTDYNLKKLKDAFGESIAKDPRIEEYLAAAYNTGVGRVIRALESSSKRDPDAWLENDAILGETKGYIVKLRFLQSQNTIQPPL